MAGTSESAWHRLARKDRLGGLQDPVQIATEGAQWGSIHADSDAAMEILVKHSADLLPTLSAEDQPRFLDILERVVDRTKLREAKRSAELADPSSSARRTVEQARVSTSPRRDRQKPLFSSLEEGFIREKTRAVEDHRPWDKHTAEQFSSTAHMWRDIVGDRPVDEYTGIDAQLFRDTMLRMPSSRGQLSAVHVVRIPAVQQ